MLIHKILTYHGETQVPVEGGSVKAHAYKAKCGTAIYSQHIFTQLQEVAIGPVPHAQCAKCFKGPSGRKDDPAIPLFESDLDQPVHDEKGNIVPLAEMTTANPAVLQVKKTEVVHKDKISEPKDTDGFGEIKDDHGLGALESNDWGKP